MSTGGLGVPTVKTLGEAEIPQADAEIVTFPLKLLVIVNAPDD
jgi:hypothetical protein